ncbi:TonB-dependent receptor domain-containing protein [Colwellia psychrerythraea]|uniref:Heme transport protein HugA n=1 Tax=Colwellia psychrerythraea (strain 34H / ATCC BAA-681) TaxID=167879 RepID=Q484C7_COLP3|nr:TonB-dependent receptor [Colwellia psychrerythraea]AAZ27419.1 heme transport protein HugA [Colwellia psychrerythraea 34H]
MNTSKVSVAVCLALSSQLAIAEVTDEDKYLLDSITVIASDTDIQESVRSPQAITAVDAKTISNISSKNVPAAIQILPNVDVLGGPTPSNENVSIRGLPQSHAYVAIDGIYQSNFATKRGSWYLNPNFIKNIKVTAGPTSGAAAGKITIETLSALDLLAEGDTFGTKIDLGYRSNNAQQDYGLSLFGKSDTLDYLVSGQTSQRDAYEIGGVGGTYDKTRGDQQSGLIKIGNQFNADQRLTFTVNYDDSRTFQVRNDVGYRDTKYAGSSLVWTDQASDNELLDLQASVYFNNVDSFSWEEERGDVEGTQDIQDKSFGYSIGNNSLVDFGLLHYGTSGHFTTHTGAILKTDTQTGEIIEDESAGSEASSNSIKLATWINMQLPVGDSFEIIPGVRYDSFYIESSNAIGLEGEALLRDGRTESRVSKSLNMLYHFNDEIKFFASYAEALNAPGNGSLFTSGRGFKPNPELKSERADNKELGVVFDYQSIFSEGDSWVSRVNIFQNDIKDFITDLYSTEWPDGERVNIGQAQLKGFEFSTNYHLGDWDLSASYGQTRGIDKNTGWYLTDMPSDKINLISNYNVNDELVLGTSATFAFTHDKTPTQQLVAGGEIEDIPSEGVGSWFTMDIFSTYEPKKIKGFKVNLSITNLFDRGYAQRMDFERNGDPKNPIEFYEEGRSINVKMSYAF